MAPSRFLKEIPPHLLYNLSSKPSSQPTSESTEGFSPGDPVYHQQFGAGVIQKSFQGSFGLTYEVHFPDTNTTRSLVAKFAKLQSM